MTAEDRKYERRALRLAERGRFGASPNPMVGAVLVRDGEVLGEGWHRQCGGPHAEIEALADCRRRHGEARSRQLLRGSSLHVSLEPCAHTGQTPPCTDALIEAGVARVLVSAPDPDPRVAGAGVQLLRRAGVEVGFGVLAEQARLLNAGYLSRVLRRRPWLAIKLGASMDGRTALASGASRWITGPAARRNVQADRAAADALITGIGTVLADDPQLNLRPAQMSAQHRRLLPQDRPGPWQLVLDSSLRTPPQARILQQGRALIFCSEAADEARRKALTERGATVLAVPTADNGRLELSAVLAELHRRCCNRVLVEAGPELTGALLQASLVDEILLYQSPLLLGSDAKPLWQLAGPKEIPAEPDFTLVDSRRLAGSDLCLRYVRSGSLRQIAPDG